jgi:hypothetical protein
MISRNGAAHKAEALQAAGEACCHLMMRLLALKSSPIPNFKDNFKGRC